MSAKKHTNPAYISHVHLKGYKSIIDTEVELHPGLNIIIGPNGSGKTNFCQFLNLIFSFDYPTIHSKFAFELAFNVYNKNHTWSAELKQDLLNPHTQKIVKVVEESFYAKNQKKESVKKEFRYNGSREITGQFNGGQIFVNTDFNASRFIWFNSPVESLKETEGLNNRLSFIINKEDLRPQGLTISHTTFISHFISENLYFSEGLTEDIIRDKTQLLGYLKIDEEISINLKKFSPIEKIRLDKNLSINENEKQFHINYLGFEFFVNGIWLNWNQLSDGTKRIFYLIVEITLNKGLILIEEPEIGTYPSQYDKILNFLKEQAEEKQIIITTHSPRTLDILEDEELDRIILTRYDRELGTKMRHLNETEIKHAKNKEDGLFLSDLWTWTSFFDEVEEI